jgi:hypothetical protein
MRGTAGGTFLVPLAAYCWVGYLARYWAEGWGYSEAKAIEWMPVNAPLSFNLLSVHSTVNTLRAS